MTDKRKEEIKKESKRRLDEWLGNSTFDEMTLGGSLIRFNMAIGLIGCPFRDEHKWMKGKNFKRFVTDEEFDSKEYDEIILELFELAQLEPLN